jgi:heme-degrading monooxygenase HmoA
MVGRQVTMRLKRDAITELIRISNGEVISILSSQKGFRDGTTFIATERAEAVASSFWDTQEDAEAYIRSGYPRVLTALAQVIEGTPTVKTFDLASATFHGGIAGKLS